MEQLYFLSILLNGLAGFMLIIGNVEESSTIEKNIKFSLTGGGFRLILGIVTAIVGILKLFSPFEKLDHSPGVFFLGDLFPAIVGIASGFILVFGFYREHSAKIDGEGKLDKIGDVFLRYKKAAGFVLLAVALLHFLFPRAIFL
jgi:membrane-bound ClpP family serine protease